MSFELIGIGELLIDLTPAGSRPDGVALLARNPGGGVPNMLNMFAKLGGRPALVSRVGEDTFGRYLTTVLEKNGVDCSALSLQQGARTTLAIVQLDESGERSFDFYRELGAADLLRQGDISEQLLQGAGMLHFSSLPLTGEPSRSVLYGALKQARAQGVVISYDPNYRKRLWASLQTAREEMLSALRLADVLKVSQEELELITGCKNVDDGAKMLLAEGPKLVLVSMGAGGSSFYTASASGHEPAFSVNVVDTTGSGDAFLGTLLYGLRGVRAAELGGVGTERLHRILRVSNAAGALTATGLGAIPSLPSREQIEELIAERMGF